ncbi:helix-turn-helix psq domain [Holotrichia oblita]|uniref:Helix-turn-helix psq domain n=1 Tax=Holotrichia oblita TaxID=644536 RepID=A0ACB9T5C3_HOLOL|nr:helix-turn-helix psq domain [Holotrichia oblita]
MPNIYKRKTASGRGNWTEVSLKAAITSVKNGEMTIYSASKIYNIPRKTLERKYKKDNDKKGPMGPSSMLGEQNEQKLVTHIKTMQSKGLPLSIDDVRTIAFHFAERLNISHRFDKTTEKAGYDWMQMFLKRSPDIRLRQSEGVSLARSQALNRADAYFQLLKQVLTDNDLMGKSKLYFQYG